MALSILDGNQSATTLSTILSSGQHITAHTVVSLGTQAITDMRGAVSGSVVSISNLPSTQTIAGTVTANVSSQDLYGQQATTGGSFLRSALYYEDLVGGGGEFVRVNSDSGGGLPIRTASSDVVNVSGTVTANISSTLFSNAPGEGGAPIEAVAIGWVEETIGGSNLNFASKNNPLPISGAVTANNVIFNDDSGFQSAVQAISDIELNAIRSAIWIADSSGSNGTASDGQILSQNYPMPISGSVTASISNSVVTFYPMQGTTVSNTNFTSITASTSLVSAVALRKSLTVFNEGAGNLHISPGATCTTVAYQVRLSAGDYWECPQGQLSLAHTAVFATAGTARVTQVS